MKILRVKGMPHHGRWVFSGIGIALLSTSIHATLPDLIIDRGTLTAGVQVHQQSFTATDCAVAEGCVGGSGQRTLIRFAVGIANIGKGDLVVGSPSQRTDLFQYSECHGHYHFRGVVRYDLIDSSGNVVASSGKRAFCLRDNTKYLDSAGPAGGYNCDNQGISAGWEDIYPKDLDCQFLDVTGVAAGRYTLRVVVNPEGLLEESNTGNNTASVGVEINGGGNGKGKHAKKPKKPNRGKHKGWDKSWKDDKKNGDDHDDDAKKDDDNGHDDGKKDDDDGHDRDDDDGKDRDDDNDKSLKNDNGKHKGWYKNGKGKGKGKGKHKSKERDRDRDKDGDGDHDRDDDKDDDDDRDSEEDKKE